MRQEPAVVSPCSARITGPTTVRGTSTSRCPAWAARSRPATRSSSRASTRRSSISSSPSSCSVLLCAVGFNVVRTVQYRRLKANGKSLVSLARPTAYPSRRPGGSSGSVSAHSGSSTDCCRSSPPCRSGSRRACSSLGQRSPGLGAAPGEQRRHHLVQPSDPGGVGHRVDPGRDRTVAAGRPAWPVVSIRRRGFRRLGSLGLGPSARPSAASSPRGDLALRCAGRRPLLLRRGHPDRAARAGLRHRPSRPHRARS